MTDTENEPTIEITNAAETSTDDEIEPDDTRGDPERDAWLDTIADHEQVVRLTDDGRTVARIEDTAEAVADGDDPTRWIEAQSFVDVTEVSL